MNYTFANRMDRLKGSAVRELMALTARPEVISFAGGMPAPELFPVEKVKEACSQEIIRRYFEAKLKVLVGKGTDKEVEQILKEFKYK